jgi:hypothetical protein
MTLKDSATTGFRSLGNNKPGKSRTCSSILIFRSQRTDPATCYTSTPAGVSNKVSFASSAGRSLMTAILYRRR